MRIESPNQDTGSRSEGEAFVGRNHVHASLGTLTHDPLEELIEFVVVSSRIVMEKNQGLHTALDRDPQRVFDRAVSPVVLLREFSGGELRVMDEDVGPFAQLAGRIGDPHRTIERHLMIRQVDHRRVSTSHAEAEGVSDVWNETSLDLVTTDREVVVGDVVERERARQVVERDRERGRFDERPEHVGHRAPVLLHRRVHIEMRSLSQRRNEERQTLDVIPVHVREQTGTTEVSALVATSAEVPQSRSEIEHQGHFTGCVESHARRVSAVTLRVIAVARSGTPNPIERDGQIRCTPDASNAKSLGLTSETGRSGDVGRNSFDRQ